MKVGFISAASQSTLYIVGTTVEGTRAAVTAVVPLARGSRARLLLLVPQIVPYPLPLDGPVDATAFTARRHRDLVHQANGEAEIHICLCRTLLDVIHALPPVNVVVGGSSGAIWPSREERLAHRLSRLGHHTVFVASRRGSWVHHAAVLVTAITLGCTTHGGSAPGHFGAAPSRFGAVAATVFVLEL